MIFSKKSLLVFLLFSLTFSLGFAQAVSEETQISSSQSLQIKESEITLNMPDSIYSGSDDSRDNSGKKNVGLWPFIKMILILLLVVAAVYGVLFFLKKRGTGIKSEDEFLRRVAYLNLGQGKSVEVITLVDRGAYLIGVTEGGINLISEVKDEELIQAMNLYADKKANTSKPKSFADVLDLFMPGGPRESEKNNPASRVNEKENVFSSGEADMDKLFQSQINRLKEKE